MLIPSLPVHIPRAWTRLRVSKPHRLLGCLLLLTAAFAGCRTLPPLESPYASRRVWAALPVLNQSGSAHPDGLKLADDLLRQLESATNIDTLPLNQTLAAMEQLQLASINSPQDAQRVLEQLGADGLIAAVVTAYDPYDPPKLGLTLELYVPRRAMAQDALDLRKLTTAPTDPTGHASGYPELAQVRFASPSQAAAGLPITTVSAILDASQPDVADWLNLYSQSRSMESERQDAWHRYRLSMDLYSDFASYVMSWRLLQAERERLRRLASPLGARPSPSP